TGAAGGVSGGQKTDDRGRNSQTAPPRAVLCPPSSVIWSRFCPIVSAYLRPGVCGGSRLGTWRGFASLGARPRWSRLPPPPALAWVGLAACAGDGGLSNTSSGPNAFTGSVPATSTAPTPIPVTAALDPRDRPAAGAAHLRALQFGEPGAPVAWRNPDTGHHG